MSLLHIGGGSGSSVVAHEGVDFDGVNDYLSRSSDLVGNVDSKTFTFSCWVYVTKDTSEDNFIYGAATGSVNSISVSCTTSVSTGGIINLNAFNSSGTKILATSGSSGGYIAKKRWNHILLSIDLSNPTKRYVFINDVDVSSLVAWSTYINDYIDFSVSTHTVGSIRPSIAPIKGRLSNIFLDYTYRNLSIEANRRLFITADGKPASGLEYTMNEEAPFMLPDGTTGTRFLYNNNDYLKRTAAVSTNSQQVTISCWLYIEKRGNQSYIFSTDLVNNNLGFGLQLGSDNLLRIYNKSESTYLRIHAYQPLQLNKWNHFMVSLDVTNQSATKIYINDTLQNINFSEWNTNSLYLARTPCGIHYTNNLPDDNDIRIAHFYMKNTFLDLSIEANRRLFINADGSPASNQASLSPNIYMPLISDYTNYGTGGAFTVNGTPSQGDVESYHNPILYLPMKDASTAHQNLGTGGDFVQNGTLATADRGANQDNCVASYFDGSADYLSRTSLIGIADGKQFTFSCNIKAFQLKTYGYSIFSSNVGTAYYCNFFVNTANGVEIVVKNSSNVIICYFQSIENIVTKTTHTISFSMDLTNTSKRLVLIDGKPISGSWLTYTNSNIFTSVSFWNIGSLQQNTHEYSNGNIGELYFDTKYIDLATNNPFWDKDTNKPVPVRKVIANTGVTPLIAMPLDASNAGKNYGTGGDFTANSAPYVGARGASEFWARSAKFDGSTGYLSRGALTGAVDSKTFSFVCSINFPSQGSTQDYLLSLYQGATLVGYVRFIESTTNYIAVYLRNGTTLNEVMFASTGYGTITFNNWFNIQVCLDSVSSANNKIYVNNVSLATTVRSVNEFCNFSLVDSVYIGKDSAGTNPLLASTSQLYTTTSYIDFSQEVNRLKFVDGLGYPLDLAKQIESGAIPTPLIYLPFDDTTNLGKNLGTGGNFTVNGSVLPSSDVLG